MGRTAAAGGSAARRDGGPSRRRRRPRTRACRHDEIAVRGEVPNMSEPTWVEHAIWWQVYPLGFVGAFSPAPPRRAPAAADHRLARLRRRTRHVGSRAGTAVRVTHTRL